MAIYTVEQLSFTYPSATRSALKEVDVTIEPGSFVVLCGPSGSGKTTLLKHLKKNLVPAGKKSGSVRYKDTEIENLDDHLAVTEVGMVFQNPDDQLVMDTVLNELTFSMENVGIDPETMRIRLAEVVHYFGIESLLSKQTHQLSGGEKQLVNLCAVLVLQPEVLIFDEPTAQLDPIARKAFINLVYQLNFELGITVIMSEHALDDVLYYGSKVIYMDQGLVKYQGDSRSFCQYLLDLKSEQGLFLPEIPNLVRLIKRIKPEKIPMTYSEGRHFLEDCYTDCEPIAFNSTVKQVSKEVICELKNMYYAYDVKEAFVLESINLKVYTHDFISIVGANGSGKSTLLKCLTGLLKPISGKYYYQGEKLKKKKDNPSSIGYVSQNTAVHFVHQTVVEEVDKAFVNTDEMWKQTLLELFNVDNLMNQHPYDLSGGEQEKLAILLALAKKPNLLLLDEPTKGLDPVSKNHLEEALRQIHQMGTTIVCITHDITFAAKNSDRVLLMFNKQLVYDGSPRQIFTENHYFTTSTNQIMKKIHHKCMMDQDILLWEESLKTKS